MSNTTTTPAAERRRLKEIDRLHTASTGTDRASHPSPQDPVRRDRRRSDQARPRTVHVRLVRITPVVDDLANAARLVDALDQVAVP